LEYDGETREDRDLVIFEDKTIEISIKRSRRELFIDMFIHWVIFKINQTTLYPYFILITVTGVGFYCDSP